MKKIFNKEIIVDILFVDNSIKNNVEEHVNRFIEQYVFRKNDPMKYLDDYENVKELHVRIDDTFIFSLYAKPSKLK